MTVTAPKHTFGIGPTVFRATAINPLAVPAWPTVAASHESPQMDVELETVAERSSGAPVLLVTASGGGGFAYMRDTQLELI